MLRESERGCEARRLGQCIAGSVKATREHCAGNPLSKEPCNSTAEGGSNRDRGSETRRFGQCIVGSVKATREHGVGNPLNKEPHNTGWFPICDNLGGGFQHLLLHHSLVLPGQ